MEHRGVEYAVVQTLFPTIWRWSVKRDHKEKVGTSFSREDAIRHAEKFIDQLIKDRTQLQRVRPPQSKPNAGPDGARQRCCSP
jgi:hypothetical protein